MTWVATAVVGSAVVGAGASAYGANKASKGQKSAADAATAEQARQYDLARNDQAPWREAGSNALARLTNYATSFGKMPTAEEVMAMPGYQFGLQTGRDALEGSAAAGGGLYSGAAAKALTKFGTDYGTTKYGEFFNMRRLNEDDIWNRDASLAGIGQKATNQLAQLGSNYANNVGNIGMSAANAQGANAIAQSNAWGNAANQVGSYFTQNNGWWNQANPYTTPNAAGAYSNPAGETYNYRGANLDNSLRGGMADGGEVRKEPKIGSRTPLRSGGTGGGLSKNALMLIVSPDQAPAMVPRRGRPSCQPAPAAAGDLG